MGKLSGFLIHAILLGRITKLLVAMIIIGFAVGGMETRQYYIPFEHL